MRSENERGHLAWAEALRKFKVPCRYQVFFHERMKEETLTLGLDSCCHVCPYPYNWLIAVQQVQSPLLRSLGKGR